MYCVTNRKTIMAKIITTKEMVESLEKIAKDVCKQEGVDYNEFIADLAQALNRRVK